MHGVIIEKGLSDWQIVQHINGQATVTLSGSWIVPHDAVKIGVSHSEPMIRVLTENENLQIIPWQNAVSHPNDDGITGTWEATLTIPAGGLYRIETGLHTYAKQPGLIWMFRGDTRLHVGIGDVFLIGGQSNSAGYGKDSAFDPPALGVHVYRNRRSWDLACHPLNESSFNPDAPNAEMGVSGVSPYLAFGKNFQKLSHYPVGLIATAKGGMPMKRWEAGVGKLYLNMLEQAKACGPIAGVLWYQGCTDADGHYKEYKDRYYHMIKKFREDLGYPVKFFTFQLNRECPSTNDEGWGIVREAQRMASHDFEDVYVLPTITCGLSDGIHNGAHSCIMLGERMARLCANVLYGTPEYLPPEIATASAEGDTIKVLFDHVKLGFVIPSGMSEDIGFTVKTAAGTVIPVDEITQTADEQGTILLTTAEPVPEGSTLSFAWEANPTAFPIMDEVTFLPPLSFYEYPIG